MCDGQNRVMQDYMRDQNEDLQNVDMVAVISSFLYQFSKKKVINEENLQLLNQFLQTLIEFCIGNYHNRAVIFNENIISVINFVLQIDITKIKSSKNCVTTISNLDSGDCNQGKNKKTNYILLRNMALEMKASAVQLLDALLEEICMKTSNLSQLVAEGLDIHALHWSMLDFYTLKSDPDLVIIQADDNAERALFGTYRIFMHLVDRGVATLDSLGKLLIIACHGTSYFIPWPEQLGMQSG